MVRLQEHLLRQLITLVPQLLPIEIAMVTQLAPQLLKRITLVPQLPRIATDTAIRQVQADQTQTTSELQELIIMILMAILQALLEVILIILELPELPMRTREVILGDHLHHQQITLEPQRQTTSVTTQMMTSGHGK